jgi:hypothetical protein
MMAGSRLDVFEHMSSEVAGLLASAERDGAGWTPEQVGEFGTHLSDLERRARSSLPLRSRGTIPFIRAISDARHALQSGDALDRVLGLLRRALSSSVV